MGVAAAAGIGAPAQGILQLGFMQRVVHLGDGGGGVAERRVGGHVLNAFAVDIDFAAVLQALQVLFTG